MGVILKRTHADFDAEKLASAVLHPECGISNPNQLVKVGHVVGRRDPLTQLQQKILTAAIALLQDENFVFTQAVCKMPVAQFMKICNLKQKNKDRRLISEMEKLSQKGLWLYEEGSQRLCRTPWFQTIKYMDAEIVFHFTDEILKLLASIEPTAIENQLIKGIQYRGKHTRKVFNLIWAAKDAKMTEYSIPELMKKLSLELTRYSYGQLKLRVLEPSLKEIYDWDDAIFVRFGPTFSGRRVEGVWLEVTTGETARKLRKKEPEFRFASADNKPRGAEETK